MYFSFNLSTEYITLDDNSVLGFKHKYKPYNKGLFVANMISDIIRNMNR